MNISTILEQDHDDIFSLYALLRLIFLGSHKTVNILFHIRKFLSGKDALNTSCGNDTCLLL